jgi:hypothetical protein
MHNTMKTSLKLSLLAGAVLLALSAGAQPADIRQGLVAYWPLDGADGSTTIDATPFGNHLTLVNLTAGDFTAAGRFGNAVTFNGSSTYLQKDHSPEAYPASGLPVYRASSYTIAMWVKGPAQTAKYLFAEGNVTNNATLLILQTGQQAANNAKFDVIIRADGNTMLLNHIQSSNVVFDGNWHHVAWVDDAGQARLYVDGNLDAANFNYTPAGTFSFHTTALGTLIRAAVSTGAIFNGQMDDVAVWERALTQAEVQQVMNNSLLTPIPELPPYITGGPASATRGVGDRVTFTVRAVGNRPLNYQWSSNSVPIEGATSASLTLNNLTVGHSGTYTVEVQNLDGTVSASATLTVLPDPPPDLRQGLVSHWPFEQMDYGGPTGVFTPDLYSRNDMALVDMDPFNETPGVFGTAYTFDGATEYTYRMGGTPIYSFPARSLSLWVNVTGTGQSDRRFFSESSTNNLNPLFVFGTQSGGANGSIRVYIRNDAGGLLLDRHSARQPLDGTWHHVVWTETNGQGKLYIDGTLDENDYTYTPAGTFTLDQTTLGAILRTTVSHHCAGVLDEVALWNRVLTFTEIQEIRTSGVPPPIAPTPPEITQHPVSQSVLTRSRVTFSFLATGTGPLLAQWRKDGADLENETNATLRLTNVTLGDAGNYDVVVTNAVGRATSQVAVLTVTLRPPSPDGLKIDFNNTGAETPADTETGFLSFALPAIGQGPFSRSFGGADVTVTGVGAILESRKRTTPVNSGDFTEEKLLQDFIFSRDAATDQGMDIAVEFMKPNKRYTVTVWSFDTGSTGNNRISDWTANGQVVQSGWTFVGSELPTTNERYQFSFDTTSDADGGIFLQGRRNSSAAGGINVFINALRLVAHEIRILTVERTAPDTLKLTVQVLDPEAEHRLEQKTQIDDADWTDAGALPFAVGNTIEAFVPLSDDAARFYRVVQVP